MTFIYKLDPYPLKMYQEVENELSHMKAFKSYRITYRQTYCHRNYSRVVKINTVCARHQHTDEKAIPQTGNMFSLINVKL